MKLRLFLMLGVVLGLYACQSKPEEAILGKWEIDKEAMREVLKNETEEISKKHPTKTQTLEESVVALLEKMQISYEFNKDGTMRMWSQGAETKGKWTINAEGNVLSTTSEENQKIETPIEEITKNKLILRISTDKDKTMTLYFKKSE
jgi:hypothetical protein